MDQTKAQLQTQTQTKATDQTKAQVQTQTQTKAMDQTQTSAQAKQQGQVPNKDQVQQQSRNQKQTQTQQHTQTQQSTSTGPGPGAGPGAGGGAGGGGGGGAGGGGGGGAGGGGGGGGGRRQGWWRWGRRRGWRWTWPLTAIYLGGRSWAVSVRNCRTRPDESVGSARGTQRSVRPRPCRVAVSFWVLPAQDSWQSRTKDSSCLASNSSDTWAPTAGVIAVVTLVVACGGGDAEAPLSFERRFGPLRRARGGRVRPRHPMNCRATAIDGLKFMREEEKLAHDVYVAMFALWGHRTFGNIAQSETEHTEAGARPC